MSLILLLSPWRHTRTSLFTNSWRPSPWTSPLFFIWEKYLCLPTGNHLIATFTLASSSCFSMEDTFVADLFTYSWRPFCLDLLLFFSHGRHKCDQSVYHMMTISRLVSSSYFLHVWHKCGPPVVHIKTTSALVSCSYYFPVWQNCGPQFFPWRK